MRRALVAALLVAAGALPGPAVGAQEGPPRETGLGFRLMEGPTELRDDARAQIYVIDHVEAGTSFRRRLQVINGTGRPNAPQLYVAPASIENGSFNVGRRGAEGEITRWASIDPPRVRLAPRERAEVVLAVEVPDDAEDGEYYGAAFAEVRSGEGDLQVASRVGIRIYLYVGDEAPNYDFEVERLQASRLDSGEPVVTATVTNTGDRALDMQGELELRDGPAGLSAGPFPAELGTTLAIGGTEEVRVVLDPETPAGPWEATLTLRSGRFERAVEGTITFPAEGEAPRSADFRSVDDEKRPWAIAASALVVAVLLLLLVLLRAQRVRRRRAGRMPTP